MRYITVDCSALYFLRLVFTSTLVSLERTTCFPLRDGESNDNWSEFTNASMLVALFNRRTARGDNVGTALSFVTVQDELVVEAAKEALAREAGEIYFLMLIPVCKPTYLPIDLVSRLQVPSDISTHILLDPFLFSVTGKTLKRVEAQRDLAVLITCDARFNEHIYAQVNKANKMLGFIRRTLSSRSDQFLPTFRTLYVALVRSHLEYASEIWSPKSVTLIKLIEGVQRRGFGRGFSYQT